ncbi:hydrolase [Hypericibacter terrae]|uniref:Hydrolase n=1 Tax=Hypericibacter terrae TaxID=2602015 RepID=A0A5J6MCM0_9PROT|nr:CocE/NonD family hydrolase [Hypericibacter terrae]QEX14992.1 hydrolase [Hypericibacter terrae]
MNAEPIIRDVSDKIDVIELAWIPMSDGRRLAARLWMPKDALRNPVPAVLEYIPYRRRDGSRARDEEMHPWVAAQGYVCARVDIAGSGDSDGLLRDEYLKQEQDDALEIIAWLATQPWCSGSVGMMGISWGGFNGLQVAARRPPALKAVIALCATVDRYHDDVHFMGGCLLADNMDWGGAFFAYAGLPPDPQMAGPDWKKRWLERLEVLQPFPPLWLGHQRRDEFWKHGSVCEDYAAIQTPVLGVSGWADGYTAAVFRLAEHLSVRCKGIVGPWGHLYPQRGVPDPAIGFLQEAVRWWDRWLKGKPNGVEKDPTLRLYLQDSVPPQSHYDFRPGKWIGIDRWPAAEIERHRLALNPHGLEEHPITGVALSVRSPETTGLAGGEWCAYGLGKVAPEMPLDQRIDDAGSLTFDSAVLTEPLATVGAAFVTLEIESDKPQALVAVRLNDVAPDGAATRVSYGLLNLAQRESHESPTALVPGKRYRVTVPLTEAAHRFAAGRRIRISVSSCYWPMAWPSPEAATLTIHSGESRLALPVLPADKIRGYPGFGPVEKATAMKRTVFDPGRERRQVIFDADTNETVVRNSRDDGLARIDEIGTVIHYGKVKEFAIARNDPLTARTTVSTEVHYKREDWDARLETRIQMTADKTHFIFHSTVDAYDGGVRFFSRGFDQKIPRDHR